MKKKGSLFYLINSLTPPEKRYFKLYCGMHQSSSNHLKLFEAMDRQQHPDDDEIRLMFAGEAFVNQLHVTKNYLQGLILKSLRNFHSGISKEAEIRNLILDAEILFSKELLDQCHYTLEKAEKVALAFEDFAALVDIYNWQRRLFTTKFGIGNPRFKMAMGHQKEVVEKLGRINYYWNQIAAVSEFNHKDFVEEIPAGDESVRCKILFHHFHFARNMMVGQLDQAELHIDAVIELYEGHPKWVHNDPNQYVSGLGNKVPMLLYQQRWTEALSLLQKMRDVALGFRSKKNKFSIRTICRSYNLELELYRDKKDMKAGLERVQEVIQYMETNPIPEDYYVLFWNQFAQIYFGNNMYKDALVWVNNLLDYRGGSWKDIVAHARILHLMVHFELGNMLFVRYAIESHRRYLKKNKMLRAFERTCLAYFSKMTRISQADQKALFARFHQELFEVEDAVANKDNLDYLDIKTWLEVKIKN